MEADVGDAGVGDVHGPQRQADGLKDLLYLNQHLIKAIISERMNK